LNSIIKDNVGKHVNPTMGWQVAPLALLKSLLDYLNIQQE
jgi:hypothetical protein